MADELKALIRKRGSMKKCLTNFQSYVNQLSAKQEVSDVEITQLRDRLDKVANVIDDFNDTQMTIESVVEDDKLDEQYEARRVFEDKFYAATASAKQLINRANADNNWDAASRESVNTSAASQRSAHTSARAEGDFNTAAAQVNVRLPRIDLPKFDGGYEMWLEYRDTFESMIHGNESLPNIQKYHYLRASLTGNASQVIKSIEFTSEGYVVAWEALCSRFNNDKLLVNNHVKSLFSLEAIHKESSSKLRKLVDDFSKHLRALEQLQQDVTNWDTLLIFIICSKLDNRTLREWELHNTTLNALPTLDDMKSFLKNRANYLETIELTSSEKPSVKQRDSSRNATRGLIATSYSCNFCKGDHTIYSCEEFLKLPVNERAEQAKIKKLCANCLRPGHAARTCRRGPCKICRAWHNSLLHAGTAPAEDGQVAINTNALNATITCSSAGQVFLATACVKILDNDHKLHKVRALLDCGSQSSFITERLRSRLRLPKERAELSVYGISNNVSTISHKCSVEIHSMHSVFSAQITCFVLSEITSVTPSVRVNIESFTVPKQIKLADPNFFEPGHIDVLIGADLFWALLESDKVSSGKNKPIFQKTKLGWVVSGQIGSTPNREVTCNVSTTSLEIRELLTKFWELEECKLIKPLSGDESLCEKTFKETTRRDHDGRFIVTLPLKQNPNSLGDSRAQAEKMLLSNERKLSKNETVRNLYVDFMSEYESLDHMKLIEDDLSANGATYYMPHHGVLRDDKLTTKLRVVFNASAPSSNGLSLNDLQLVGPVLQDDLLSILLRFRKHTYVVSADIAKMYRQVLVEPHQRDLQRILWRERPSDPIKSYALNTVTYGQASASFLSIRCLFELANECEKSLPDIANIIRHDFYVDDLLTGADTIEDASRICQQVSRVLKGGCFDLRKWYSNNSEILSGLPDAGLEYGFVKFSQCEQAKTLGLTWSCESDHLLYRFSTDEKSATKRNVLSAIARIFDPLGLLSPCTVIPKVLMQELWASKISWDQPMPDQILRKWTKFRDDCSKVNELSIPRHVVCPNATNIELHGFSDASEKAYGSCIYIRSTNHNGNVFVHLLCSKSKVAPIKTETIPRLELCAALLLSRLTEKVVKSINIEFDKCVLWSDSTIVLAWIKSSPSSLKTFASNRVAEIQNLTSKCEWRHVPTYDNPADLVSRGIQPSQIAHSNLWWHGPQWLIQDFSNWPDAPPKISIVPELREQSATLICAVPSKFPFERFSRFLKMKRVAAYVLRFKYNCQKSRPDRNFGPLTADELKKATYSLIRASQMKSFYSDYSSLQRNGNLASSSKLIGLSPYLDNRGIIRVGGRIKHSPFSTDKKHPMVLDSKHIFTKLLFEHRHNELAHAGPQLLLSAIRDEFWPVGGRNLARFVVRQCTTCFRFKPEFVQPIMGDLPADRVTPSSPFSVSGVDYAGPFQTKSRGGRGFKSQKCYICIFVCFATKAVHLELVSDLTTDAFLAALRRFVSRRGKPTRLYSDNGTNLVGASRELGKFLTTRGGQLAEVTANERIDWHFIPPRSPHFGGLWEAGIKSVKHHLRRVLGNVILTFEEFSTILAQVEAILNSRPITPMSNNPNDYTSLSPAHFLIGRRLIAAPDEDVADINTNRLTRFQLMQNLVQHFWQRWSKEYLVELQRRNKWTINKGQLEEGAMVLVKEDHALPTEWCLGRIVQLHPGRDGVARVATVKTAAGEVKRDFSKLAPLPIESPSFQGRGHVTYHKGRAQGVGLEKQSQPHPLTSQEGLSY